MIPRIMTMCPFNPEMFRQKPKRKSSGPRPNLMTHEKRLKESAQTVEQLQEIVRRQSDQIQQLQNKISTLESTVNIIGHAVNKR